MLRFFVYNNLQNGVDKEVVSYYILTCNWEWIEPSAWLVDWKICVVVYVCWSGAELLTRNNKPNVNYNLQKNH